MDCKKCGAKNPENSNFCNNCGLALEVEVVVSDNKPNLVDSTKLMFKDIFRYGKCMSRADFWYGELGSILLFAVVSAIVFGLDSLANILDTYGEELSSQILSYVSWYAFFTALLTLILINLAAGARRSRDIGMSGGWTILQLVPIANILFIVFMCQKSVFEGNYYRFETQSALGKRVYGYKGLVIALVLCGGLVFSIVSYFTVQTITYQIMMYQQLLQSYSTTSSYYGY